VIRGWRPYQQEARPVDEQECLWCDRMWALLGLLAGMGIAYMAIDLLGGGLLTKSLTKRVPRLAAVIDMPAGETDAG
jgi:hypothetical protein